MQINSFPQNFLKVYPTTVFIVSIQISQPQSLRHDAFSMSLSAAFLHLLYLFCLSEQLQQKKFISEGIGPKHSRASVVSIASQITHSSGAPFPSLLSASVSRREE